VIGYRLSAIGYFHISLTPHSAACHNGHTERFLTPDPPPPHSHCDVADVRCPYTQPDNHAIRIQHPMKTNRRGVSRRAPTRHPAVFTLDNHAIRIQHPMKTNRRGASRRAPTRHPAVFTLDMVRRYFTVQARMWHLDVLDLKPETSHLKPCLSMYRCDPDAAESPRWPLRTRS